MFCCRFGIALCYAVFIHLFATVSAQPKVNKKKEVKYTDSLFEKLMGKKAEFRYKFIQENANFIKQIDI